MKALTQSSVTREPRNPPEAVCPFDGKCPSDARCPIESECPLEAEETARWIEEVEANRAKLKASGGLSDAEVIKLAAEYGLSFGKTKLTPKLRQLVEDHWCLPTVEYPPEVVARWKREREVDRAQIATGELVPQTAAEMAAELGITLD